MNNINLLSDGLNQLNITCSTEQIEQFNEYYRLLIEWNNKFNLTSITDEKEVIVKHFLDSIMIADVIDLSKINNMIDIGTGAGFPSIPIKILFPHIKMTLLDSLNKRINFLDLVSNHLSLDNMEPLHGRAEELGKDINYREKYDLCVSRAVSNLSSLSEYCIPFIKVNGLFVSYKSQESGDEISSAKTAIDILGGEIKSIENRAVVNSDLLRNYVVIEKISNTDDKYPRRYKKISRSPL